MKNWKRIIYEVCLSLCILMVVGAIFIFSSENAENSTNTASTIVNPVI